MIPSVFLTPERIPFWPGDGEAGELAFSQVRFSELMATRECLGEGPVVAHYLGEEEQAMYWKFSRQHRRLEWLAGRIAAKHAVLTVGNEGGAATKECWQKYRIAVQANGRPYMVPGPGLPDISISHSGHAAVAAARTKGRCGIDIQEITEQIFRVQERFATAAEAAFYQRAPGLRGLGMDVFLTLLWAAKESLRKGVAVEPLAGFLELQLTGIAGNIGAGLIFEFLFTRKGGDPGGEVLRTCQFLQERTALAVYVSAPAP